jgi:excisionase family DNA binding protein
MNLSEESAANVIQAGTASTATERLLLRATEVARLLNISRSQVYSMMQRGNLPTVRIGRAVRVSREALLDWVRASTHLVAPDGSIPQ